MPASPPPDRPGLQVVAMGNALLDVLADCDDDKIAALGAVKGTMTLVDDSTAMEARAGVVPSARASGGSAANTAACLASLGAQVEFVGKVADDEHGRAFAEDIRAAGVRFTVEPWAPGEAQTGTCLVLVTPDAEKTMFTHLGAASMLTAADVGSSFAAAEVTYIEGYLLGGQTASAVRAAVETAGAARRTVALSASDPALVSALREPMLEVAASCQLLFANEDEARGLASRDDVDHAAAWLQDHLAGDDATVVVTLGAAGCLIQGPGGAIRLPAFPVGQVVDTTGAGDSFAAGYLYGRVSGRDEETCGRLGGLAAAHIVSHLGARPTADLATLAREAGLIRAG